MQVSDEQTQQQFQQLNLQEIGLQPDDFQEVLAARKELSDLSHNAVAEYGKNIATKTSSYTDELLGLVQNKDLGCHRAKAESGGAGCTAVKYQQYFKSKQKQSAFWVVYSIS